jgi:hypothetical protein
MGWIAVTQEDKVLQEDKDGRPMELGSNGGLKLIAQEDFGHSAAIDLIDGVIYIDYETPLVQDGIIGVRNPKVALCICDDVNIVGEYKHLTQKFFFVRNEEDTAWLRGEDGEKIKRRNDILTPLIWRPIWFTRWTNGVPTKIIGAQTTTPEVQGATNVQKKVSFYIDGRLGID